MPIDANDLETLKKLVNTDEGHREVECGNYLHHAIQYLLPSTPVTVTQSRENRSYFGSSDFVVTADLNDGLGGHQKFAYIWELKAPQCYLFEYDDNKNRCRPTQDFIKAENQLIHYMHEAKNDDNFRARFHIMERKNIRFGGIIIGRSKDRILRGSSDAYDVQKAKVCLGIRADMFYASHNIRILTWDEILRFCV